MRKVLKKNIILYKPLFQVIIAGPVGVTLQALENLCRNAKVFFIAVPNGSLLPGEGMAIKKTAQPHGCAFSFAWAVFGSHRNGGASIL